MDTTRRGFLRALGVATAAGAALPVIDRLDFLARQPTSIIKPEAGLAHTVNVVIRGMEPGTRVVAWRTDEVQRTLDNAVINGVIDENTFLVTKNVVYTEDIPIVVVARKAGYMPFRADAVIKGDGLDFVAHSLENRIYA